MAGSGSVSLTELSGVAPVGLVERSVEINGLMLGAGTDYLITAWDGFGTPEVRTTDEAREREDGDWLGTDTLASRTMTLNITIRGTGAAGVTTNYTALLRAWSLDEGNNYTNLWFLLPGHSPRRAIGRPRRVAADMSMLINGRIDVVVEFYSPFSPFYGENQNLLATGQITTGGGRRYTLHYPKRFIMTVSGGQTVLADNDGSYPSWGVLTFSGGVVSSPRLYNESTGQFIGFDVSLTALDTLIVDMRLRTATLNGASIRHTMRAGATWWNFPAGTTTVLRYLPVSYDSLSQCAVVFAPAHRG